MYKTGVKSETAVSTKSKPPTTISLMLSAAGMCRWCLVGCGWACVAWATLGVLSASNLAPRLSGVPLFQRWCREAFVPDKQRVSIKKKGFIPAKSPNSKIADQESGAMHRTRFSKFAIRETDWLSCLARLLWARRLGCIRLVL